MDVVTTLFRSRVLNNNFDTCRVGVVTVSQNTGQVDTPSTIGTSGLTQTFGGGSCETVQKVYLHGMVMCEEFCPHQLSVEGFNIDERRGLMELAFLLLTLAL